MYMKKQIPHDPIKSAELIKKLRKEHEKMVKGMFEFIDAQGGFLDFVYKFFPEDPVRTIHITHGEVCELPLGIVKHLNNTKKKVRCIGDTTGALRGNELPEKGRIPMTHTTISRVRFTPMDVIV